jgi:HEPN domain-containing protein
MHSMKATYTRTTGRQLTYEIEADVHGSYTISLAGKVLKRLAVPQDYYGKKRWGSKAQAERAIEDAKRVIETLAGMDEE